ncbi:MAG: bifunctional riboflavin kinase/FAD synthetase [Rhodanobacter denitrificans]|uniref:Riboflavin biosynthesis protein n=1 Tax=Rhodanobacter denitrificans TaxID=666685 RepID=A0A2W5K1S0_9GAMM|nr:MAG: bifunctional riboflavin kinase/FAD synthetase [Rhodanobacter denitrificans]
MIQVFEGAAGPSLAPGGSVACVGAFDGVHRGHRALLDRVRARADARGLPAVVVSFEPIPREFFARGAPLLRLSDRHDKIEQFEAAGIDRVLLLGFDAELAGWDAQTFIDRILIARLQVREVFVGADFRFGRDRQGDIAVLREAGERAGFSVEVFPEFALDGERVRSSRIREKLAAGDFDGAAHLLGRRFRIGGEVVHGQQLGRRLGYPTANIALGTRTSPVGGIFAVRVHGLDGGPHPGVASLGVRPTVDGGGAPLLEAHLFDFDGDLYGRRLDVEFVAKLRDEEKFADLDALVRQMDRDAAEARTILGMPQAAKAGATA